MDSELPPGVGEARDWFDFDLTLREWEAKNVLRGAVCQFARGGGCGPLAKCEDLAVEEVVCLAVNHWVPNGWLG